MLKVLTGPRQRDGDQLPTVVSSSPRAVADGKLVGPAREAVLMLFAVFPGPNQSDEDRKLRLIAFTKIAAAFPTDVVVAACDWLLAHNPQGGFPPTTVDLHKRCCKIEADARKAEAEEKLQADLREAEEYSKWLFSKRES